MSFTNIEVLVGQAAHEALADSQFLAAWQALYTECPHATGYQAPKFVCTWYDTYRSEWQPVVVRSAGPKGQLVGLWLLAQDSAKHTLVQAGAHQAEYHAWLALPGEDAAFLALAWVELQRHLPFETLRFKYLPTARLADKLRAVPGIENRLAVKIHSRPVAKLDRESIEASFAKKSNKSRFNRLKRLGNLEFRRLTEPSELAQVFDDLIAYYDFRQGAINHVTPFREDPLKCCFHSELFASAPDETHVTVTYLNGRAIAALWGIVSGLTVHLGMLVYSPLFAEHSPGKLHMMLLSDQLLQEGKEIFDLTPGGDPWKERFANAHDEVAEVILYRSAWMRKRANLLGGGWQLAKRCSGRVGVTPSDVRGMFGKLWRLRPSTLIRKARNWTYTSRELRVHRGDRVFADKFARDVRVLCNSLPDLLSFEPGESWQTRDAFLSGALSRLERGESVYTISIDNRLAHCGWMVRNQTESYMTDVQQSIALPSGSVALYDYYTHPDFREQDLARAMIGHMLCEAFTDEETQYAYISVLADTLPLRHVIETMGFQYQGSLYWERRFGLQTKWVSPVFAPPEIVDA